MVTAASRTAVNVAYVNAVSTISPLRFSLSTCPSYTSLASAELLFRFRRAAGSVLDSCVSFVRFCP